MKNETIILNINTSLNPTEKLEPKPYLLKAVGENKLFHAYILSGGTQKAKLDLIQEINAATNCLKPNTKSEQRACGNCRNCLWIAAGTHPDTPVIVSEKEGSLSGVLPVELIRQTLALLNVSRGAHRFIVFSRSEVDFLHKESANTLLKELEEPRGNTTFFFLCEDEDAVLPTVRSRCLSLKLSEGLAARPQVNLQGRLSVSKSHSQNLLALREICAVKDQSIFRQELDSLERELLASPQLAVQKRDALNRAAEMLQNNCKAQNVFTLLLWELSQ